MIIECLTIFLEIIINLPVVIENVIAICTTGKRKRQLINLLYRTTGKEGEKQNIVEFYNYVNHRLNSTPLDSSQVSEYSIKRLKKELKPNESRNLMTFILGDPGSGKSTLMLHLAYWYCRYNNLQKRFSPKDNLKNLGILYCRMRDYQSLKELKEILEDNYEAVFLDGFDEFIILQDESEEIVLEELLGILLNKANVFRKIYISSRKEPFRSDLKKILEERNFDGHQPLIIEICPFDRKQILSLYKKNGKRRNIYKMRRYLSDKETIFRIPLLIQYADIIIKDYSDNASPSLWQALHLIEEEWIDKVAKFWYGRQELGKGLKEKKEVYKKNAREFILRMCKNMIQNKDDCFKIEEIEKFYPSFNEMLLESENRKFFFSTRQLIHKKNEDEYEFIHPLFKEYFAALLLVSLEGLTFEQRKRLLNEEASNYHEFYVHWLQDISAEEFDKNMSCKEPLLEKLKRSIEGYVSYYEDKSSIDTADQIHELISADCISLKEDAEITVYGILWIFPLAGEIKWKSYQLSLSEITDLMEDGKLSLTDGRLKALSDLQYFSPMKSLDIRNNNIIDLKGMQKQSSFEYLCLYGNRLKSFEPLKNIKILKLELSIWNEENLEELSLLSADSYNIDLPEASSLYIKLNQLENFQINWRLAFPPKIADFRKCYNKLPYEAFFNQILEAAFRWTITFFCTEKHFESAAFDLGEEVGKSFYLRKEYERSLEVFRYLESAMEKAKDVEERIFLRTRGWIGQVLARTGEYGRAIPLLECACGEQWKDDADIETKIMWFWLLKSLRQEKHDVNVEDYGINNIFEVMLLWGKTFEEDGQLEEAEKVLRDLYQRQGESIGEKDMKSLKTQHWLGLTLYFSGQYEESERELNECWQKRIEVLGERDQECLDTQYWLGATLAGEKKYKDAESMLSGCYEKCKEVLGEKNEKTLAAQCSLGEVFYNTCQHEEAERELSECWRSRIEVFGERDTKTLYTQLWLGATLNQEKKYKDAERVLCDCYQKRKEVQGEKHEDTLRAQHWLGMTFYDSGQYEEAERELSECWKRRTEVLGESHKDSLETQNWLGATLNQKKKYEEERKLL